MKLSKSGKVVIIDDNFQEIFPLFCTLSKINIPYLYYNGEHEGLPDTPLSSVRFLFLDIELSHTKGADDKSKASSLAAIIENLITINNGPFAIFFWSKHSEVIELVLEYLKIINITPVFYTDLDKNSCLASDDSIAYIGRQIEEEINKMNAFQLYVEWENVLHESGSQFISEFSQHVPFGEDWSSKTGGLFYKLYKSYVDKNVNDDTNVQFQAACHVMNRSFFDTLEKKTSNSLGISHSFRLNEQTIEFPAIAKINSSLFLNFNRDETSLTGRCYQVECVDQSDFWNLKNSLISALFKETLKPANIGLCEIIITPECDIAQNKTLKINGRRIHRMISGLLCNVSDNSSGEFINRFKSSSDVTWFKIGPFWYNGGIYYLICHFGTIKWLSESELEDNPIFSIKREMLFDLQSKSSNHVNRLGNYQLT